MDYQRLKNLGLFLICSLLIMNVSNNLNELFNEEPVNDIEVVNNDYKKKKKKKLPKNFKPVYTSFKSYNPHLDSSSAITVARVANHFGISNDREKFKWSLGQLLLESGAQQYYQPTHPKEGQLVVSSAGAIGFCQIMPATAYGVMTRVMDEEEIKCFYSLGASDFSFAYDENISDNEKINMVKEWLSDETNNIIMWGKIMSAKFKKRNLICALIAYNAGPRGLYRFLELGKPEQEHSYIVGIKTRLKYINL